MIRKQSGFTLLLIILIFVVITVIIGVGWLVVNGNKQTENIQNKPIQTLYKPQNEPIERGQNMAIKEWGIKIKIESDTKAYYRFFKKGDKYLGSTASEDTVAIYSDKFNNLKNSDGIACKDVDDILGGSDPSNFPKPPELREFLTITRFPIKTPDSTPHEAAGKDNTVGGYEYSIMQAILFGPGCSGLWRGIGVKPEKDNNIIEASKAIYADLVKDFSLLTD